MSDEVFPGHRNSIKLVVKDDLSGIRVVTSVRGEDLAWVDFGEEDFFNLIQAMKQQLRQLRLKKGKRMT